MKIGKIAAVAVGSAMAAAAALACRRLFRLAWLGAAYTAKTLGSGIFVAHREPASLVANDLAVDDFPILGHMKVSVDYEQKEVSASFLGIVKRRARYTPGLGCSLCYPPVPIPVASLPSPVPLEDRTPLAQAFDPRLDAALDRAFSEPDPKRLKRTRAVVILHDGRIVAERYATGFGKETPLHGWSMTKLAMNALVGILVKEGRLALEGAVPVPEWQGPEDPRGKITLNQLLQMSSGLKFCEEYGNPLQDVTWMLLAVPDAASFAAAKPLEAAPGTFWSYSSGTTNIISRIIRTVRGNQAYWNLPRQALFEPLGMASAVIEPDASGTFVGSSFMYATARDWAKLGQLYLQDGVWAGQRILPEGWVTYSTTPAPAAPEQEYGAHVWLKTPAYFRSDGSSGAPAGAFHAAGHEGQLVTVVPSKRLVIVRLGSYEVSIGVAA